MFAHRRVRDVWSAAIFMLLLIGGAPALLAQPAVDVDEKALQGLHWRSVGPAQFGGRVADVVGVPGNPDIMYAGHSSAGLYKSTNGGTTFESVFNEGNTLSVGAVALAPTNPDIVYLGTGEGDPRNSISYGDGVYKSTDGGASWTHLGLPETHHISKIAVHPKDPGVVFVAAMGHAWGGNPERGVYRSTDGGETWEKVLYLNETTGASEVLFDPQNPKIMYAGMYDHRRKPWHFRSGGPGSGLYRSTDGGDTWTELTAPSLTNGLPGEKRLGRIGVDVSRSDPRIVYALIESEEPGELWRSKDRGRTWTMVNDNPDINSRPFYFTDVRVDPGNPNRVYTLSGATHISTDGGRTFEAVSYQSQFGDVHAMWIDPENPDRLLSGSDGGFYVSNDAGRHFEFLNTMPFAQVYHVGVDMADPYHILGGFQDHEIWRGPNEKWNNAGVRNGDWTRLRDMADGMYALADPRNPNRVYYNGHFGDITRVNVKNGEEQFIQPYPVNPTGLPAKAHEYRFSWNAPIEMSPTDPDRLYFGGNVVFKTTDKGNSWEVISPDLTTDDPSKQELSGGITLDNTRAEYYCTILTLDESPVDPQVLWAGTDDGHVQVTQNGGDSWTNVASNMPELPENAWVATIKASPHDAGTAWVAVDQHRSDDYAPYAYVTRDYGQTWTRISDGLKGWVHIVAEDPEQPNLLYAGTELGIFVSFDGGTNWTDLRLGLPPLSVRDLVVHPRDNDLVIGTHARGFYILDDVTPLQGLAEATQQDVALFEPMRGTRYTPRADAGSLGDQVFLAPNEPYGVLISYYLSESAAGADEVEFTISDSTGTPLRTMEGPAEPGLNRAVWDLRENLSMVAGIEAETGDFVPGPRAMPGSYSVQLSAAGQTREESFRVRLPPTVEATPAALTDYYDTVKRLMQMQHTMQRAMDRIESIETQIAEVKPEIDDADLQARADSVLADLAAVKHQLDTPTRSWEASADDGILNLQGRVRWLVSQVSEYTGRPTEPQKTYIQRFDRQLSGVMSTLDDILHGPLADLNERLRAAQVPHIDPHASFSE